MSDEHATADRGLAARLDPRTLARRYQLGLLGLVVLAVLPPIVGPIWTRNLTLALYFAMFAMSWDVVSGYTGQISFGHAFFFAIGGYTSALLNLNLGLSPLLTVPAGVVLAVVGGLLIGVPALRLRGPYFSLVTLVTPPILLSVFTLYSDVFGGELGLPSPDQLLAFDDFATTLTANFYLAFVLFIAIFVVLFAVTRSDAGAVFTAIREDPDAVAAAGLNPAKFKVFAVTLSAAVGGLAGAVFVHTPVGSANPSQLLVVTVSIEVIIASVLGGMGTIVGAAVGGLFLRLFQIYLGQVDLTIPLVNSSVADVDLLLFSVVTLVLIFLLPQGIVRWVVDWGRHLSGGNAGNPVADGGRERPPTVVERVAEQWQAEFDRLRGDDGGDDR